MKRFEEIVRKKLFNWQTTADDHLWQNIEKSLPKGNSSESNWIWSQYTGLVFMAVAVFMFFNSGSEPSAGMVKSNNNAGKLAHPDTAEPGKITKNESKNSSITSIERSKGQEEEFNQNMEKLPVGTEISSQVVETKYLPGKGNVKFVNELEENKQQIEFIDKQSLGIISNNLLQFNPKMPASQTKNAPEDIILPERTTSRWSIFAEGNPMLLYRQVTPNTMDDIDITALGQQSPLSLERFGYQLRLGANYNIHPNWQLHTAINYQYNQQNWKYNFSTQTDSFKIIKSDQDYVFEPVNESESVAVNQKEHFYGLAAGISYTRGQNVFQTYRLEMQSMLANREIRYFMVFDIILEKPFNDYWSIYGGPGIMWQLNGQPLTGEPYSLKSYSIGLNFGVRYQLSFKKKKG